MAWKVDPWGIGLVALVFVLPAALNLCLWRRDRVVARRLALTRGDVLRLKLPAGQALRVSFLVAAWNERDTVSRCIEAVLGLSYPDVQLVICAGGSDGSYEVAGRYRGERVTVLGQRPGEGKQRSLQRCLERATGSVLYLIDADCLIDDQAFYGVLAPIVEEGAEAVTGSFYASLPEQIEHPFVLYQCALRAYAAAFLPADGRGLLGGNCALRRDVLEGIGGFDTDVRTGTDYELAKRLLRDGRRIRYQVNSTIRSEFPESLRGYARQQARWIRNVVLHGLRFHAYGEVAACLRTSSIGLGMLLLPLLWAAASLADLRLSGLELLPAATWCAGFLYAALARLRYLHFAKIWLDLRCPLPHFPRVAAYLLLDFLAWSLPLAEYAFKPLRTRW
ncbi:MAG: glycosyltransferase family 2 protein [Chloroflexota bacterium]